MIATYTLQEKDYTGLVGDGEESTGRLLPVLNSDEKHHFLSFRLFNKNILKQEHAKNAAKSAEIDLSELLRLQNVLLRHQPCLGQS